MKTRFFSFLRKNGFMLGIAAIAITLAGLNFAPGTWLSGWDTLHPEFNFLLALKRLVFGVWREEQGLGAMAGHSHMADLPRVIFLWFTSLVLPTHLLRYFFFGLCLALGPVGVYVFISRTISKKRVAAFFGAWFYLFNLATVQQFYVPFEMFAVLYAALPWLFYLVNRVILWGRKRDFVWLAVLTLLASPMAYAATLWYVYFGVLVIYGVSLVWLFLRRKEGWRRLMWVLLLTLALNAYWILPNAYFVVSGGAKAVSEAKINQMFSETAFSRDQKYATLGNAALLKGFLFDWQEYDQGRFVPLLRAWEKHMQNPGVLAIGWGLFGVVLLGLTRTINFHELKSMVFSSQVRNSRFIPRLKSWVFARDGIKEKNMKALAYLPVLVATGIFLLHGNLPFSLAFEGLRNQSGIVREALRFPWTKFSIFVLLGYSIYFAQGVTALNRLMQGKRWLKIVGGIILAGGLVVWMWPAFRGNLIDPARRISLPEDYFKTFAWFDKQLVEERVGIFPVPTFWGWDYTNWGFEGAGFWWFGLKQPVLVRDFDRWNRSNENYYWEVAQAVYSKNLPVLEKVLDKYQVKWLVVDESMVNPAWPRAVFTEEIEQMLTGTDKVTLAETFGKIKIYRVNLETPVDNFVFLGRDLPVVGPEYKWNNFDKAFVDYGNYVSLGTEKGETAYYPFRSLFTGKEQSDVEFKVEERDEAFVFKKQVPDEVVGYKLNLGEFDDKELMWVDPNNLGKVKYLIPQVSLMGNQIEVIVPKAGGYFSAQIEATSAAKLETKNCSPRGEVKNEVVESAGKKYLRLSATDATNCSAAFELPNLSHDRGYLITVESRNVTGKPLVFWIENQNIRKADLETNLPRDLKRRTGNGEVNISYWVQPPMEKDGVGYVLHFDNTSIGREEAVNELGKITVSPLPYKFLTGLVLTAPGTGNALLRPFDSFDAAQDKFAQGYGGQAKRETAGQKLEVEHPNPSLYVARGEWQMANSNNVLVLSQAFDKGWRAYAISSKLPPSPEASTFAEATADRPEGQGKSQSSKLQLKIQNLKYLLAPVLGEEIKDHVLVNNWENGWEINSNLKTQGYSNSEDYQIVIIYLPQYLEYAGWLMLAAAVIGVVTFRR